MKYDKIKIDLLYIDDNDYEENPKYIEELLFSYLNPIVNELIKNPDDPELLDITKYIFINFSKYPIQSRKLHRLFCFIDKILNDDLFTENEYSKNEIYRFRSKKLFV